jgi:hypothetical protein
MQKLALTALLALSSFGAFLTTASAHDHCHPYPYYDNDCYPVYCEPHHRHHHPVIIVKPF